METAPDIQRGALASENGPILCSNQHTVSGMAEHMVPILVADDGIPLHVLISE